MDAKKPPVIKLNKSKLQERSGHSRTRNKSTILSSSNLKGSKFSLLNTKKLLITENEESDSVNLTTVKLNSAKPIRIPSQYIYNTTFSIEGSNSSIEESKISESAFVSNVRLQLKPVKRRKIPAKSKILLKSDRSSSRKLKVLNLHKTVDDLPKKYLTRIQRKKPRILKTKRILDPAQFSKKLAKQGQKLSKVPSSLLDSQISYVK